MGALSKRAPCVALVSMPWTTLTEPSLGLGILKAVLNEHAIAARVWHLNVDLLRHMRAESYYAVANVFALNDFLFSHAVAPEMTTRQLRLLRTASKRLLSLGVIDASRWKGEDGVIEQLLALRNRTIPLWLDECADRIVADGATLVGFTCMFDQTIASVALAKQVKARSTDIMAVLGGYAARPPTASTLLEAFPWIDAVCEGEGEPVIERLARASVGEDHLSAIPGMTFRDDDGLVRTNPPGPLMNMDTSPIPDYDDFFSDIAALRDHHKVEIDVERLPLENSRGCWWGAKSHCVFCGIANSDMAYRAKSPARVIETLDKVHQRYGVDRFRFSDYILPQTYYRTLLPLLAAHQNRFVLTGEIKANIKPEWMQLLSKAGFTEVQPGIESLSDDVLGSMRKGVTSIQNVHTLLLGKAAGVLVHYNLIYGFPGDMIEDYEWMISVLPNLFHLDPPSTRLPVQITRYAPLQEQPARFGLYEATHDESYDLIFSEGFLRESGFDLNLYCYYFERPFENAPKLQAAYRRIDRLVDHWKKLHRERDVVLSYAPASDGGLVIVDTRGERPHRISLDGAATLVLRTLRHPRTREQLRNDLADRLSEGRLEDAIKVLLEQHLLFEATRQLVALPLPASTQWRHQTPMPAWDACA